MRHRSHRDPGRCARGEGTGRRWVASAMVGATPHRAALSTMSTVRARSHRALSLRLLVALGVAVIATAGPFGDVSIAQAATPVKLGTSTTFYGRGWGHGVGMSQYGARGRALAGQKAIDRSCTTTTPGRRSGRRSRRPRSGSSSWPASARPTAGRSGSTAAAARGPSRDDRRCIRRMPCSRCPMSRSTGLVDAHLADDHQERVRRRPVLEGRPDRPEAPAEGRLDAPPAVVEADLVRPLSGLPADRRDGIDQGREHARPRHLSSRCRAGRDALVLADRSPSGAGHRGAQLCGAGHPHRAATSMSSMTPARRSIGVSSSRTTTTTRPSRRPAATS